MQFALWRWVHELCHACLGHCFLMALIGLCRVSVSWREQGGWPAFPLWAWGVCWPHRARAARRCGRGGWRDACSSSATPVLMASSFARGWAASWGWELFVCLLQGGFVDGMWKEQILRKRRKRRKGWSKWIVKKEGEREVKEWRKAKWEERWRKWGDGQVQMEGTGNMGSPA